MLAQTVKRRRPPASVAEHQCPRKLKRSATSGTWLVRVAVLLWKGEMSKNFQIGLHRIGRPSRNFAVSTLSSREISSSDVLLF